MSVRHPLRTHFVPGQRMIERPVRSDLRRDAKAPDKARRHDKKAAKKAVNKRLKAASHQGRVANTKYGKGGAKSGSIKPGAHPNSPHPFGKSSSHASTRNPRGMVKIPHSMSAKRPKIGKDTGMKVHAPRVLHPHHPQAYRLWSGIR